MDKSKAKLWKWIVKDQCGSCIARNVKLKPTGGSLTTTFNSGAAGTFYIAAYYQENVGYKHITDYIEIKVTR